MGYSPNMMNIDPERLRNFAAKNGGLKHISLQLGYSRSYLSNVADYGRMRLSVARQLSAMYGVPEDFFRAREPEKPKAAAPQVKQMGYALRPAGTRRREGRQRILEAQRQQRAGAGAGDQLRGTHDLQILRAENAAGIYGG